MELDAARGSLALGAAQSGSRILAGPLLIPEGVPVLPHSWNPAAGRELVS